MRFLFYLFIFICFNSCAAQEVQKEEKINGITLVATHNPIDATGIKQLTEYNANYAVIVPYAWMKSLEEPQVHYDEERGDWGEKPKGVNITIDLMKEQNLEVLLKPQLWIGRGDYTGNIALKDEAHWKILEDSYTEYIMRFVHIAASKNVGMFCIGTELDSFVELRPKYWDNLIVEIRKIYKGKLTYAGNWDSYKHVHFWKQLDFIGVDAYFPLSEEKTPTSLIIQESWKKWVLEMSTLSRKLDKKILFTEYGYISADYAGLEPWKNAREDRLVNEKAQAVLFQGLYDAVWDKEWFAGGFIWKHHAEESRWRGFEKRFTTQGKEAQKVVAKNYLKFSN
ncbi:MAG: glycoside hydrolase family 113 [Nonlabens sp.]|uniref:glycoside hydrolase family 113 n=1 Tax=Nonlabens sp. TaxID=1888209 RepID=UPI003EF74342